MRFWANIFDTASRRNMLFYHIFFVHLLIIPRICNDSFYFPHKFTILSVGGLFLGVAGGGATGDGCDLKSEMHDPSRWSSERLPALHGYRLVC